jgi:hypothetical protein
MEPRLGPFYLKKLVVLSGSLRCSCKSSVVKVQALVNSVLELSLGNLQFEYSETNTFEIMCVKSGSCARE